jgi:hypothetical protein
MVPVEALTTLLTKSTGAFSLPPGAPRHGDHRDQPLLIELVLDLGQAVLRQHERHLDRLDLGNGDQRLRGGTDGGNDIAGLDEDGPCLAVNRRDDPGVIQVDARGLDSRFVGHHDTLVRVHFRGLGRKLLVGDGVLPRQRLVTRQVQAVICQGGGVARQLALGLAQCGLIRSRIDLEQHIAFMNDVAFAEIGRKQRAGNLRRHLHHGGGDHRTDGVGHHRNIAALRQRDFHRRRRRALFGRELCGNEMPGDQKQQDKAEAVKKPAGAATQAIQALADPMGEDFRSAKRFVQCHGQNSTKAD